MRRLLPGVCLAAVLVPGISALARAAGANHVVSIDAMAFQPAAIVVKAGDTVTWKNTDPFPHTVSASGYFTSPEITTGGAWSFKAGRKGSYTYVCTLHPTMTATIVVK